MKILAAILLSTAAAAMSSGALAQSAGYDSRYGQGPQTSTPTEMQQTDELNRQGTNGTYQSPATLNGEQSAQDQQSYQPQQAQYQSQQQQYQDQMQRYNDQQQRYRYDQSRYEQNLREYDIAQYAWSYPAPVVYHYEGYGLTPLYLLAEPSHQLAQAPVEGPDGRWVGRVRNVDIGPGGQPNRVEIALNRRVSVWVHPGSLRFDPTDGVVYTDLTRDKLWSMPGATIESGPM